MNKSFKLLFGLLLFSLPLSQAAHAVLGENDSSLQAEGAAVRATVAHAAFNGYTRHEIAIPKLTLHQFASSGGKVFAVAWHGSTHPDFKTLMGTHFDEFEAALTKAKATSHGHAPIEIELGNLHVELGGHARAVNGRVWLIDQLPSGVTRDDVR